MEDWKKRREYKIASLTLYKISHLMYSYSYPKKIIRTKILFVFLFSYVMQNTSVIRKRLMTKKAKIKRFFK